MAGNVFAQGGEEEVETETELEVQEESLEAEVESEDPLGLASEESEEDEDDLLSGAEDDDEIQPDKEKDGPYYGRVQQIARQRREERERAAEEKSRADRLQGFVDAISERYKQYEDPQKMLREDASFMDTLEAMHKEQVPGIAKLTQMVLEYQRTGKVKDMADEKTETTRQETDPRVQKLLERETRQTVDSTLAKTTALFRDVVAEAIVSRGLDPDDLTPARVKEIARSVVAKKGLTSHDIYGVNREAKKDVSPASGGRRSVSPSSKRSDPEREEKAPEAPKTLEEQMAARQKRFEATARELGF